MAITKKKSINSSFTYTLEVAQILASVEGKGKNEKLMNMAHELKYGVSERRDELKRYKSLVKKEIQTIDGQLNDIESNLSPLDPDIVAMHLVPLIQSYRERLAEAQQVLNK